MIAPLAATSLTLASRAPANVANASIAHGWNRFTGFRKESPCRSRSFWRGRYIHIVCDGLTLVLWRTPPVFPSPFGLEYSLCQDPVGSQLTQPLIPLLPPGPLIAVSWPAVLTHNRSAVTGKGAAGAPCKPHPGLSYHKQHWLLVRF